MESLIRQLEHQRTRLRNLFLYHGVAQVVLRALCAACVLFLVDYLTDPPRGARIVLTLLGVGYVGYAFYRYLVYPLSRRFSTEEMALNAERKFPEFDGGLVSALQFHALDDARLREMSPSLVRAAKELAVRQAEDLSWNGLYDTRNVKKLILLTLGVFLLVAGYAFTHADLTGIFASRMMGGAAEWPRQTTLLILLEGTGENYKLLSDPDPHGIQKVMIARGTSLPINVQARGKDPREVTVLSASDSSGDLAAPAVRRSEGQYRYRFRNVREDMRFWVEGGDDDGSGRHVDVSVVLPPQLSGVRAQYRFPDYLGLEGEVRESAQIEGPEGTEVQAFFSLSSPVASASIAFRVQGGEDEHPLTVDEQNPLLMHHTFTLKRSGTYRILLSDSEGFTNTDAASHSIIVRKDGPPRLKLYAPRRSDLDVASRGVVVFRAVAEDDYGLARFGLSYKSAGEPEWERHEFTDEERDAPIGARKIVSGHVLDFDLARFRVGEEERKLDRGDVVLYTVEASDFRPDQEAGSARTAQHGINIVSESEKIRILTEMQIRLKEEVRSLREQQADRWEKGKAALQEMKEEGLAEQALVSLEVAQNKLTNSYKSTSREMAYIFDGYLFNRIDRTSAATALLERAVRLKLDSEVLERFDTGYYQILVDLFTTGQLGEMDLLERLMVMLSLTLKISETLSPTAGGLIASAVVAADAGAAEGFVEQSVEKQQEIVATLDVLLDRMSEWEDYQELLQLFRDVIDAQHNVNVMTREELRKKQ